MSATDERLVKIWGSLFILNIIEATMKGATGRLKGCNKQSLGMDISSVAFTRGLKLSL